jgi:hypothetical protein
VPTDDGECAVAVLHSTVRGADGYVLVTADGNERDCEERVRNLCVVVYPSAPGCGVTMRATDGDRRGAPSRPFCVREADPS